ncbi:hypothetical protein HK102_010286 [Quaeritorhiza haematococci]|nr:hypothetical protein HK102_010286 [Quaeritorhiza haematococci]
MMLHNTASRNAGAKHWIVSFVAFTTCLLVFHATQGNYRDISCKPPSDADAESPEVPKILRERSPHIPLRELERRFHIEYDSDNGTLCPVDRETLPPGWITDRECCLLYHMAKYLDPIYEQGPFRGRSTSCIAKGIKDSGLRKTFITVDIFPMGEKQVSLSVNNVHVHSTSAEQYEASHWPIHKQPGGLLTELLAGLSRSGALPYVNVVAGTTAPDLEYRFIFTDAAYKVDEIKANLPQWKSMLRYHRTTVFIFHDLNPWANAENSWQQEASANLIREAMDVIYEFGWDTMSIYIKCYGVARARTPRSPQPHALAPVHASSKKLPERITSLFMADENRNLKVTTLLSDTWIFHIPTRTWRCVSCSSSTNGGRKRPASRAWAGLVATSWGVKNWEEKGYGDAMRCTEDEADVEGLDEEAGGGESGTERFTAGIWPMSAILFGGSAFTKRFNDVSLFDLNNLQWTPLNCSEQRHLAQTEQKVQGPPHSSSTSDSTDPTQPHNPSNADIVQNTPSTPRPSAPNPPIVTDEPFARSSHAMVAVSLRGNRNDSRYFMFGGGYLVEEKLEFANDLWVLVPNRCGDDVGISVPPHHETSHHILVWKKCAFSTTAPPPMWGMTLTYVHNHLVLFGGRGSKKWYSDIWVLRIIDDETGDWINPFSHTEVEPGSHSELVPTASSPSVSSASTSVTSLRWRKVETVGHVKPCGRHGHTLTLIDEEKGYLLLFGGWGKRQPSSSPTNSTGIESTTPPSARMPIPAQTTPAPPSDDEEEDTKTSTKFNDCYRLHIDFTSYTAHWVPITLTGSSIPSPRCGHVAERVGGKVYVFFGRDDEQRLLSDGYVLNVGPERLRDICLSEVVEQVKSVDAGRKEEEEVFRELEGKYVLPFQIARLIEHCVHLDKRFGRVR